jgi:hypothetical protein
LSLISINIAIQHTNSTSIKQVTDDIEKDFLTWLTSFAIDTLWKKAGLNAGIALQANSNK